MSPRSELKIEIYKFALEAARLIMNGAQRVEAAMVHLKVNLIAKIYGAQATYGW